ncbi:MAG TPA: metalloregulator ArsR/SmtB family transcription factor [Gammaproteobacteria bacterium]|nr:metalloregulator ArsR/SmtB family transcription factor [Gammaproteobacteria bacterium]
MQNNNTEQLFRMLADNTRLRSLMLIQLEGELCVCELTHSLALSQPMVSRHLSLLKDAGLVNARREGQWMYYSINPALEPWMVTVLQETANANKEAAPFVDDLQALKDMPNRPGTVCCA